MEWWYIYCKVEHLWYWCASWHRFLYSLHTTSEKSLLMCSMQFWKLYMIWVWAKPKAGGGERKTDHMLSLLRLHRRGQLHCCPLSGQRYSEESQMSQISTEVPRKLNEWVCVSVCLCMCNRRHHSMLRLLKLIKRGKKSHRKTRIQWQNIAQWDLGQ